MFVSITSASVPANSPIAPATTSTKASHGTLSPVRLSTMIDKLAATNRPMAR